MGRQNQIQKSVSTKGDYKKELADTLGLKRVVNEIPTGMIFFSKNGDEDLHVLDVNPSALKILDLEYGEVVGSSFTHLFPDLVKTKVFKELLKVAAEGKIWYDNQFSVSEKSFSGIFEVKAFQSAPNIAVMAFKDITKQKKVEKELRESEEKYRSILESIEEGYFEVDLYGTLTFFNHALEKICGLNHNELMGLNNREYTTPETGKRMYDIFNKVYTTGKPAKIDNYEIIAKDGMTRILELSASLIRNKAGDPVGFRGVVRDATQRFKAGKEKKKLQAKLQQAQKMELIGTLAGGVAHDLNNILVGIVGYPDLLLMNLSEDNPMCKPIMMMKKSGEKAAAIVQDLLTLARRGVTVAEVVNLNHIVLEYLESPDLEKANMHHPLVEVETDLADEVLNIKGSHIHLYKSLMNLCSNAFEAMPEGGTLKISTKNLSLDQQLVGYELIEKGDYVTLSVSDNGIGMQPGDMEKVFEPFYTKKIMGRSGTGLGMAVVWGTVKDHRGFIDLRSAEKKGTTATLFFPVFHEIVETDEIMPVEKSYTGNGESILVIDDLKEQRDFASAVLTKLGYHTSAVCSGEDAIDYLKQHTVDLLVLDMMMDPGMNGYEAYQQILKLHPGQKAIIVSGYSQSKLIEKAKKLGAATYLKKPYKVEELGLAVYQELRRNK